VPDRTRDPRIPEGDHRWYTLGGSVVTSPRTSVDFFLVHLTTEDASIDVSDPNAGTLKGEARWTIWNVGIGATFRY
jgi:long-subunit fatty acid transport protein